MKRLITYLVAIAGVAGLGWWAWGVHRSATPAVEIATAGAATPPAGAPQDGPPARRAPAASGTGDPRGPIGVEAARAERVSLSETVSAVGTLRANESVTIKPEVAGLIERIHFDGGARVRKGALLVSLDASIAAAEAEQTRAELGLAQANYQRTADLARQQFVSERARDEAAASLKVLEARLKLAQARLAKSTIRAPFSGVLGLRNVSAGDFVREGAELVTLEDVSLMKVDLRLPERYLGQLRPGQLIEVEFDAYPGRRFEARMEAIDVRVDADGRSLVARGRLPNADGLLRSGMFAKVTLTLSERDDAVMVPEEAVFPAGDEQFVYRIDDGKATRVRVRTGLRREGRVEIVEGVRAGELVVTAGQVKLNRDGTEVRVVEPPRPGG
ncbi:MAG TPA: efflux RND transporter periplasmic adaptor subunit [Burkholderiaceae bacterium]|jgi:membrane fusion protein (multidrug efflux system)|nr:efflux RND transporter periplasmic adaptor subunit [Burkholderiaceae bacterium]